MPRRPQRRPNLRGHALDVVEAVFNTAANPFAQFTRFASKPSGTKTVQSPSDIPESFKRGGTPLMAPDVKKQKVSLSNSTSSSNMSGSSKLDGDGSGQDGGLRETPIDDPFNIQRGPPDYSFATLPYVEDFLHAGNQWMRQHTFRMTSPYDCRTVFPGADLNTGSGTLNVITAASDASDSSPQKARWFDLYASMYKYYHVIACRWWVTFENQTTQPVWVHQYYGNETDRPTTATNVDMMLWKDTRSYYVGPAAMAIQASGQVERGDLPLLVNDEAGPATGGAVNFETGNMVNASTSYILQLSGEYRTGDFEREIRTDNLVENWTLTSTNPALSERLNIRVRPQNESLNLNDTNNYNQLLTYRMFTRIEYLVEFKELKDGLKYPIAQQPAVLSITTTS